MKEYIDLYNDIKDDDNLYILTKKQLFELYKTGEWNIDNDGCTYRDSVKNFEEELEDIIKEKHENNNISKA